jgi:solute:Na+ symporter, SSS family
VWVVVIGNLFANLVPYTTDQSVIQRYLTTPDEKQAGRAIWTNAFLTIPASLIFFAVGTALFVFYSTRPESINPNLATDAIFPWFISRQLPVGIAGIVIAGLFAAAMSSLDSSMNSIATSIVTDFYKRMRPDTSDRSRLRWARWLTLILGATGTGMAMLIASYEVASLWDLFLQIVGLFGGSVAGVFALGVFTTRAHGTGTLIGAVSSAVLLFAVQRLTDVHFFLYAAIGIVCCVSIGWLASLIIPTRGKDIHGLTIYTMGAGSRPSGAIRPARELLVAER